jgi:hypothetical protein
MIQWYDLDKNTIKNTKGIYILYTTDIKVGKTKNPDETLRTYRRSNPNVKMLFIETEDMDKVEANVLNIFANFRIENINTGNLSECIKMDEKVIKIIIEFCIENIYYFYDEKLCRSINTIHEIQFFNNNHLITHIIERLLNKLNFRFSFPMELNNNSYAYLLNQKDFYDCLFIFSYV